MVSGAAFDQPWKPGPAIPSAVVHGLVTSSDDLLRLDSLIALPSVLAAAASYFWINIGVVPAMTCISQGAHSSGSRW